jgi:pimeloyl-ACP methyl ester carboxylesterase
VGKIRVHYKDLGKGETAVVFVHGFACDLTTWRFQAPAFAGRGRLLLIDLPGHGQSDKPKTDYSMDLFARAVAAVMDDAGVRKAVLVGHSMGTPVVRQFWRLYPDRTVALVAVDGMVAPLAMPRMPDRAFDGDGYRETMLRFADRTFGPDASPEVRRSMKEVIAATPRHVALGNMKAMADPAVWKDDPIKVPVQMILAPAPVWPADYEGRVRKLAPRLEFHRMPGVGHCLMLEKPKEFNALLAGFLVQQGVLTP